MSPVEGQVDFHPKSNLHVDLVMRAPVPDKHDRYLQHQGNWGVQDRSLKEIRNERTRRENGLTLPRWQVTLTTRIQGIELEFGLDRKQNQAVLSATSISTAPLHLIIVSINTFVDQLPSHKN